MRNKVKVKEERRWGKYILKIWMGSKGGRSIERRREGFEIGER